MTAPRQVLAVTKGHDYDHNAFSEMLDSLSGVACTQVEQPAAQLHFAPDNAGAWDAFLMYDMPGYRFHADHSPCELVDPPAVFRARVTEVAERGHGFVFLHHALAAWPTWDEYGHLMGGRFRFVREPGRPDSGYRHDIEQRISVVAPEHSVVAGVEDGFTITDEVYLCDVDETEIEPLLVTNAELISGTVWSAWNAVLGRRDTNDGWERPDGSPVVAWVRRHPASRIVYIQFGDGPTAFGNPAFRRLVGNALRWVAGR